MSTEKVTDSQRPTVLLVDDDINNLELLGSPPSDDTSHL